MEWAKLRLDLAPVVLLNEADSLTWLLSANVVFSTKSLMMDTREKVEAINLTLANIVWKGNPLKKNLQHDFIFILASIMQEKMKHKTTSLCNAHMLRVSRQRFSISSDGISHFLGR